MQDKENIPDTEKRQKGQQARGKRKVQDISVPVLPGISFGNKEAIMTILDKIVKDLRGVNWSSFVSFDEREARAIKRASRKWPVGTLGYIAAQAVRPTKLGKDTQPLSYGDDAYYIREAILGRHYRRGVYRVDETKKAPAPKNEGLTPPGEALQLAAGNTRRENGCYPE